MEPHLLLSEESTNRGLGKAVGDELELDSYFLALMDCLNMHTKCSASPFDAG